MNCRFRGADGGSRMAGTAAMRLVCLVAMSWAGNLAGQAAAPDSSRSPQSAILTPSYTPHRVFDTRKKQFIDFETLASRLAAADLVFVGEQHNDPATHRMELAILEGIARRRDSRSEERRVGKEWRAGRWA